MIPSLNVAYFVRIYSVANTPAFLYRHLLADESVRELARKATTDELVNLFNDNVHRENRSINDVAIAYAALVAITLREFPEALATLLRLDAASLDWVADMANYWDNTRIS